jgi:hypothetical protein
VTAAEAATAEPLRNARRVRPCVFFVVVLVIVLPFLTLREI